METLGKWIKIDQTNDLENWDDLVDPTKKDTDEKNNELNSMISDSYKTYIDAEVSESHFLVQFLRELKKEDLNIFEEEK
jgi:hypothetical protein